MDFRNREVQYLLVRFVQVFRRCSKFTRNLPKISEGNETFSEHFQRSCLRSKNIIQTSLITRDNHSNPSEDCRGSTPEVCWSFSNIVRSLRNDFWKVGIPNTLGPTLSYCHGVSYAHMVNRLYQWGHLQFMRIWMSMPIEREKINFGKICPDHVSVKKKKKLEWFVF